MRHFPYKGKAIISQTYLRPNNHYTSGYHLGIDMVGQDNKNIYTIEDGEVILAKVEPAFGNTVIIKQVDRLFTRYSHLAKITVSVGQRVIGGITQIGVEGRTGSVYGSDDPRHLDIRISRKPYHTNSVADYINPAEYLNFTHKLNALVGGEVEMGISNAVLMWSLADLSAGWGESLKHGKCAMFCRDGKPEVPQDAMNAQHLIITGGPDVPEHPNRTYLSGSNMGNTLIKVGTHMTKPS